MGYHREAEQAKNTERYGDMRRSVKEKVLNLTAFALDEKDGDLKKQLQNATSVLEALYTTVASKAGA